MEDYLSEKEQWEWLKGWIRENGIWIVAGIVVGVAILVGMRWWNAHVTTVALEAGAKYQEILQALDRGDTARAQTLTIELERDYRSSPYTDQARLLSARIAVDSGDLDRAAENLKAVMEDTKDDQLALVARLRLARVHIARGKPDEAIATLNAVDPGAFGPRYDEVRGDALYAKGDKAGALKAYQSARVGALTQSVDAAALDLKIQDLVAENVAAGGAAERAGSAAAAGSAAGSAPAGAAVAPAADPKPVEAK